MSREAPKATTREQGDPVLSSAPALQATAPALSLDDQCPICGPNRLQTLCDELAQATEDYRYWSSRRPYDFGEAEKARSRRDWAAESLREQGKFVPKGRG